VRVSVEVPQGFSLSVDGKFYPYCTSRNCTVMQALSDAGIHAHFIGRIAMSLRTYPIRVGSLPGQTSGDCYEDQEEITFESIGQEPEFTTVTGRKRRIFTWSRAQVYDAIIANRPDIVFLNFCNYVRDETVLAEMAKDINFATLSAGFYADILTGYGPNVEDVRYEDRYNSRMSPGRSF
jgi:adenylosuccinate synthase